MLRSIPFHLSAVLAVFIHINMAADAFTIVHPSKKMMLKNQAKALFAQHTQQHNERPDKKEQASGFTERKEFLDTSMKRVASSLTFSSFIFSSSLLQEPANAAYGASSNIELPSYIDFLIEKNKVDDPELFVYKGADLATQLTRLSTASQQLSLIPAIAKERKWSQVQGILTGPLGTLLQTMNTITKADLTNNTKDGKKVQEEAKKAVSRVKQDILVISQEASKRNEEGCIKAAEDASRDLEAFVKLVF